MSKKQKVNYKEKRNNNTKEILESSHPRKIIVGGPGTGKSYLFKKIIGKNKENDKEKFLAITFVGKLCDKLADDLAGLAETRTLHSFARKFVLDECPEGWLYYPKISKIIKEDIILMGKSFEIGNEDYERRTKYYKAIGEEDVIYYAVKICNENSDKIPKYDLILVDEFQDLNEKEVELIDLLATENEVVVVGDDDQALYGFKDSFAKSIREKFHAPSDYFEKHTLRYCSRCTEVIIEAFREMVRKFQDQGQLCKRIDKDYFYFPPSKKKDSSLNKKIFVFEKVPPGMIQTKIKYEFSNILKTQKIKTVLIIGEGRTCKMLLSQTAEKLRELGFKNIESPWRHNTNFVFNPQVVNAYKFLQGNKNNILAWRLLMDKIEDDSKKRDILVDYYDDYKGFINALSCKFKKNHRGNAKTLNKILNEPKSRRDKIALSTVEQLLEQIVMDEQKRRDMFVGQLIDENKYLPRPLLNLDITVCNILGSKGLGADIVFLIGFDQGKLPMKQSIEDGEIYQFLVALTRARKRLYLINTIGNNVSKFIDYINPDLIKKRR